MKKDRHRRGSPNPRPTSKDPAGEELKRPSGRAPSASRVEVLVRSSGLEAAAQQPHAVLESTLWEKLVMTRRSESEDGGNEHEQAVTSYAKLKQIQLKDSAT